MKNKNEVSFKYSGKNYVCVDVRQVSSTQMEAAVHLASDKLRVIARGQGGYLRAKDFDVNVATRCAMENAALALESAQNIGGVVV